MTVATKIVRAESTEVVYRKVVVENMDDTSYRCWSLADELSDNMTIVS